MPGRENGICSRMIDSGEQGHTKPYYRTVSRPSIFGEATNRQLSCLSNGFPALRTSEVIMYLPKRVLSISF